MVIPHLPNESKKRLYIDMSYNVREDVLTVENTNVKRSYIPELLCDWIRGQIGRGEDNSPAAEKDVYNIRIEVDLSDDTFYTRSDTGNKGLTAGIIMTSIGKLKFAPGLEQRLSEEKPAEKSESGNLLAGMSMRVNFQSEGLK